MARLSTTDVVTTDAVTTDAVTTDAVTSEDMTITVVPDLQVFGQASLADYCGDLVLYRNLSPLDKRLLKTKIALRDVGLAMESKPRKQDKAYARVALWYAEAAHRLTAADGELTELLFIGDTLRNDGGAFRNMVEQSDLHGACFIGTEKADAPPTVAVDAGIYTANRWTALVDWVRQLRSEEGFLLGDNTVVIVDIDKTALGAKGRNDKAIDQARIQGAYRTITELLGQEIALDPFVVNYSELNRSKYHEVTEDNQDYLVYICLVIASELLSFEEIERQVDEHSLTNFDQFTRLVETRMMINSSRSESLRQAHDAVVTSVRSGDPTPFKRFRRQEFIATVEHMGRLPDAAAVEELLAEEITLTEEVCAVMEWLQARGCVIMCMSDKPDEASMPDARSSPALTPVHRTQTHRVGTDIRPQLNTIG